MSARLPLDLYSADQLSAVIIELREHIGNLHDSAARARVAGHDAPTAAPHISALLLGTLHNAGVSATDPAKAQALLRGLKTVRDKAPIIHLILAALPNRTVKRTLTEWFRQEIHPFTLLTFAVRSDVGGGVIINAGSHVYDFSFRQQLLSHKGRISEIFASVRQ